ncbi:PREDICTED: probable aquaporin NIP4-2 isoform X2 [Papilio polytes]|uniref:probable aquaporin NIP4-2 isoform X2 n=1 Tax=Papilio polytes TaxID=76194 RepID=UPI00067689CF|nr:PREDICTED: probable aquaporin NIP4-2 isoform X2 [Papilio polytes]
MGEQTFNITDDNIEQHIITLFEKLECMRKDANSDGMSGKVPARLEVRTLSLWKAVLAECAASFLYVFIVCGAAGGAGVGASASAVLLATALASGCAIATITLCFAHISGAHVNPAVSAALCVRRRVSPLRAALYVAAQCGGAIAGAAAIYGVSVPGYAGSLAASLPGGGAAAWERLGAELLLSGLVAAAHFAGMERRWTGATPALLGAAYCAASFVSMPSLNPARSLGPSFVLSRWESHWVCWVGGLGGGVACALLHEWGTRRPRANTNSRASSPRDMDELDKPAFPTHHYRHAPSYCSATAPRPDNTEPLYSGSKSLYCRSPPPARHALHRSADGSTCLTSQSVYSKGSSTAGAAAGALGAAQSLLLRPAAHALALNQNAHNAQRDPAYGTAPNGIRPGPAGQERRESVYSSGARRGPLSSEDSAYGSYAAHGTLTHGTHAHANHASHAAHAHAHGHATQARPFRGPHPPEHY